MQTMLLYHLHYIFPQLTSTILHTSISRRKSSLTIVADSMAAEYTLRYIRSIERALITLALFQSVSCTFNDSKLMEGN